VDWAAVVLVHRHVWAPVVAPEVFGVHPRQFLAGLLQDLIAQWLLSYLLVS